MPASDKKSSETSKKMPIIMDGDRIYKMEVDYSSTCDEKIPAAEKLAEQGKVSEAVDSLMILEKQTRTVSFVISCQIVYSFIHLEF